MPDTMDECEAVAYREGLAAGLAAALDGLGPPAPPGRIAALPVGAVAADAQTIGNRVAHNAGIAFVRSEPGPGEQAQDDQLLDLAARLGAVRIGVTRQLTDRAVDYLSNRDSGGERLIRRQLVIGALADLHADTEVLREQLKAACGVPVALLDAHDRVTALDWEAVKLLGASGYIAGGGADLAHASRLTANCWLPRGEFRC